MAAIVSSEIDLRAPGLDQAVYVAHGKGAIAFLALEEKIFWIGINLRKIGLKSLVGGLVDDQDIGLACFLLFYVDRAPGLFPLDIFDLKAEQVSHPEAIVDPHCEKEIIPGAAGQKLFYGADVFQGPDGLDRDAGTFLWMVLSLHGARLPRGLKMSSIAHE